MKNLVIIISILFIIISCNKQNSVYPAFFYDYYPANVGSWLEYEVIDITHNTFGSDTLNYYLKEIRVGEFIDNEGEVSQRIERYWKFNISDEYEIKDVWYGKLTSTTAEKVEENIRYTKMIFPIKQGQYWNGNAYNNLEEWEYSYDSIHEPYIINNITYDSTVRVIQRDNFNALDYENCYEIYAKNIGVVYKQHIDLSINLYNILDINEGEELEMKLISFGQ